MSQSLISFPVEIWIIIFQYSPKTKLNEVCKEWNLLCQNYTETMVEKYGFILILLHFIEICFIPGVSNIKKQIKK